MEKLEEFVHNNCTVKIFIDPEPSNPRTDWDNGTIIAHWHSRYKLGESRISQCSADELKKQYEEFNNPILHIMPLYLFDHSGISISVQEFSSTWDSGQVGWVFITESKVKEMGFTDTSPKSLKEIIESEVKNYDAYLNGRVYGYEVYSRHKKLIDSCWGFIDDIDDCRNQAKAVAVNPVVKKKDLKDQTGMVGPRPILVCDCCGAEYSANAGDYFMENDEHVFTCCDEPLTLMVKKITYEPV